MSNPFLCVYVGAGGGGEGIGIFDPLTFANLFS